MNRKQSIVLFLSVSVLVGTWLFPPWSMHQPDWTKNLGYRFLFTWAQTDYPSGVYFTIDWARLLLADLIIVTIGGWLFVHVAFEGVNDKVCGVGASKPPKAETPFERFKRLTKHVVSVPHAEIQKRETEWKNGRKQHNSHHRHR